MWPFNHLILFLVALEITTQCIWSLSFSHDVVTDVKGVVIRNHLDCQQPNSFHKIDDKIDVYNVSLEWTGSDCSNNEVVFGFFCEQHFSYDNNFENLGKSLCVDLQGVQTDLKKMTQLKVTVSDNTLLLKKVYSITRMKPITLPYYVCTETNSDFLQLAASVRDSVNMCPHIFNSLRDHKFKIGSVSLRPMHPIVNVDLNTCYSPLIPDANSYLVKVSANGAYNECGVKTLLPLSYSYMRGCLKHVYSTDLSCNVRVRMYSENEDVGSMVELQLNRWSNMQKCETFSARNGQPILVIESDQFGYRSCQGQFAFQVDFQQTPPPDREDNNEGPTSPNLYMAVFITLIAICLVCLGLTCLCCIRFRAKRLRRIQRRSQNRPVSPTQNQGFQYDAPSVPGYDNILWNPSQPAMLYGLPTYDEVVAETSSGINPSDDPSKNELPPTYDSVYPTSES